jgi:hypothetical protein
VRVHSAALFLLVGCTPDAAAPAFGVYLDSVEANQGVPVVIARDGDGVDGADRTAPLISDRATLLRAFWKPLPTVEEREVTAVLHLEWADGDREVRSQTRTIEDDADPATLEESFSWTLSAEETQPGLEFRVELWDGSPGEAQDYREDAASLPADGNFQVGIEVAPMRFEVVIVPLERAASDCTAEPDVTPGRVDHLRDRLFMQLPVQEIDVSVREPVVWTEPIDSFDPIIEFLGELKQQDGAETQVYYYGLLASCGVVDGFSGQAYSIPPSPSPYEPWSRVATGLSFDDAQKTSHVMTHELGHVLGRRHIECSGAERKPDEDYPYEPGTVGGHGWGVLDGELREGDAHADYMGYCDVDWVSDYGWNITYFFIRAMSAWEEEGVSAPESVPRRVGRRLGPCVPIETR